MELGGVPQQRVGILRGLWSWPKGRGAAAVLGHGEGPQVLAFCLQSHPAQPLLKGYLGDQEKKPNGQCLPGLCRDRGDLVLQDLCPLSALGSWSRHFQE